MLPLEFSRISGGDRLTLVINPDQGVSSPTRVATSQFTRLEDATEDLRKREGTKERFIGYVDSDRDREHAYLDDDSHLDTIHDWVADTDFSTVIWTDLCPKFNGETFSVEAALEYLEGLEENGDPIPAAEYIIRAPSEVQPPSRSSLQEWAERVVAERS